LIAEIIPISVNSACFNSHNKLCDISAYTIGHRQAETNKVNTYS